MSKIDEKVDELKAQLDEVEVSILERGNYRLSDAIREGSSVTEQATGAWGDGVHACALSAAVIAKKARGY